VISFSRRLSLRRCATADKRDDVETKRAIDARRLTRQHFLKRQDVFFNVLV
jgi:hypothetical protein